jgi:hypothetical protein
VTSVVLGLIAFAIVLLATHTACSGALDAAPKTANAREFRPQLASLDCTVLGDDCVTELESAFGDPCFGVASNLIDRCHEFDRDPSAPFDDSSIDQPIAGETLRDDATAAAIEAGDRVIGGARGDELGRPSWLGRIDVGLAWRRTTTAHTGFDRAAHRERGATTTIDQPVDELWLLATWSR